MGVKVNVHLVLKYVYDIEFSIVVFPTALNDTRERKEVISMDICC